MDKTIQSAELVQYNANNRGKSVGDCVKRSISLAFDVPYFEVGKLLNEKMKRLRYSAWNIQPVFEPVIRDLGATNKQSAPNDHTTVEEFADTIADPSKSYLLLVGEKYPRTSHLVCVRNGKIWDSWNCKDWFVSRYYTVDDSVNLKELTDIKDHLKELFNDYIQPILLEEMRKQVKKYNMKVDSTFGISYKASYKGYAVNTQWDLEILIDDVVPKDRFYTLKITLPFEPTMTMEDAIKYIQTTGKTRMYDRMYAVAQEEKKLHEEYDMLKQIGKDSTYLSRMYATEQEERFIKSLPGWARALLRSIHISEPGKWLDSYSITINKLPTDDTHPDYDYFRLEGYDADEIREQLDRYAKYGEIVDIDYPKDY